MRFSIVIPTYNEEADIAETITALLALEYPDYEIIIVDESSDQTPAIIQSFDDERVQYRRQSHGTGRSAARNQGITEANGEIVLILNADVHLPKTLLTDLLPHYIAGADYVLVESEVENIDHLLPRYIEAGHRYFYPPSRNIDMNWTEGFSCRRSAAIAAGLFPEGKNAPILAGEDGWFGERLRDMDFTKVFARDIKVTHIMPEDWRTFLQQRAGRGHGSSQVWANYDGYHGLRLFGLIAWHLTIGLLGVVLILPSLWNAIKISQKSPYGWLKDFIPFTVVRMAESLANMYGIIRGYREVLRSSVK